MPRLLAYQRRRLWLSKDDAFLLAGSARCQSCHRLGRHWLPPPIMRPDSVVSVDDKISSSYYAWLLTGCERPFHCPLAQGDVSDKAADLNGAKVARSAPRESDDPQVLPPCLTGAHRLGEVFERYHKKIYRYCLFRLFTPETAEDVTSKVFLVLAERIASLKVDGETGLRRWLYEVARRTVNAHVRQARRNVAALAAMYRERGGRLNSGPDVSRTVDWPAMQAAISKLKSSDQHLVVLRFVDELRTGEIARILGKKEGAVRVALFRAVRSLRRHLKLKYPDDWGKP